MFLLWQVDAATKQAPPEQVLPPTAAYINSTSVLLTWSVPITPNGIITEYNIYNDIAREDPQGDVVYELHADSRQFLINSELKAYCDFLP